MPGVLGGGGIKVKVVYSEIEVKLVIKLFLSDYYTKVYIESPIAEIYPVGDIKIPTREDTEMNGIPATKLRQRIKDGGILVDDKLVHLIITKEFPLDELVYFSEMTRTLYFHATEQLRVGLSWTSDFDKNKRQQYAQKIFGDQPTFDDFAVRAGVSDLSDALSSETRRPWLTTEEKMFEAVSAKLRILELAGYETARLAKSALVERRTEYLQVESDARRFFNELATEYSKHPDPG